MFPAQLGYRFPAEWAPHAATWLSWPHKEASWPGKIQSIYGVYAQFVKALTDGEQVCINVNDAAMQAEAEDWLRQAGTDLTKVSFYHHPTNDAWCRDHGPAFLANPTALLRKVIVKWKYNAWGEKYPPHDLDNLIPFRIGEVRHVPVFQPGIVMEGGAVDFNGRGTVLTTTSCLLNPNRNPHLSQAQIEEYLHNFYGVAHVDDITRFVNEDTVVTAVEPNVHDENHAPLQENLETLRKMRLENGQPLNIVELPMPGPVVYDGQRLPASYANFYIGNTVVAVPTFRDPNDEKALRILETCFPGRTVIGFDSTDIIWGLGSFHCLSQQEPL